MYPSGEGLAGASVSAPPLHYDGCINSTSGAFPCLLSYFYWHTSGIRYLRQATEQTHL